MATAKQNFSQQSEDAIHAQINMELQASYTYMAFSAFFARDNVALPGLEKYFRKQSDEEREHAQKLIDYVNKRGGRVSFAPLKGPESEVQNAQNVLELTLRMERDVNASLLNLVRVAEEQNDAHLSDFIEGEFLEEQVESIKQVADMVTQLHRIGGDGLGLYLFDRDLLHTLG